MDDSRPPRLYREPEDKKLAGVCSGLADYFGLDPTVVRLAMLVAGVATGFALVLAYLLAVVVIPVRPESVARAPAPSATFHGGTSRNNALLVGLLVVALLVLVGGRWSWWWFDAPIIGSLLVAVGLWLLYARETRPTVDVATRFTTPSDQTTTLVGEGDTASPQDEVPPPIPPWGPAVPYPSAPQASSPPPARTFPTGVVALLLIVGGFVALLSVFDIWDMNLEKALGVGLLAIGASLVVGAWMGRTRALLALGMPALVLLVLCDTVDVPLDGGSGDRDIVVTTAAELRDLDTTQEMLAGELVLDLSNAPLGRPGGRTTRLSADVGLGSLEVRIPESVTAEVNVEVGVGGTQIDGSDEDGVDVDRSMVIQGAPDGGRIELDLHVGLGEVEVIRG